MSDSATRQLAQDRALRDAALELVKADISHLRTDLSAKGMASRFASRMSEGAVDLYEEAAATAEDNRGILAALVAAVVLWFARNPILSLLGEEEDEVDEWEQEGDEPREIGEHPADDTGS